MARAWPVQPREGFTGLPNAILARAIGELTPEQLRLFLGLVYSAEWRPEGSTSPDGRWRVGRGQVLVSYDGLAKRYGMEVDAVRRALRRFEGVVGATRRAAPPATGAATSPATPPSLVDFGDWFGIQPSADEAATPPATPGATPPATSPAPIQHGNTGTPEPSSLRSEGAPPARRPRAEPASEGFQQVVQHWFVAWERAGRGKHASLTQAEGKMLKDLVRQLGPDELVERIDRAFDDPWFLERGDLGLFRKQVQRYAKAGGPGRLARGGDLGVLHGGEWWRELSRADLEHFLEERKAIDPELDEDAPFPALGVTVPDQVEELIARTRAAHERPLAAVGGR